MFKKVICILVTMIHKIPMEGKMDEMEESQNHASLGNIARVIYRIWPLCYEDK